MKMLLCFLLITCCFFSCAKKQQVKTQKRSYPVAVATAIKKTVPIYIDTTGHVVPISAIDVKSRVEGILTKAYFKEGQDVKKGDLLFTIDKKPFTAQLDESKAILQESIASLAFADDKVRRFKPLVEEDYYSIINYEELKTTAAIDKATVAQNKANVDLASINLDYCSIYAPVDGKAGMYQIDPGNMVFANKDETLVTINQIKPIYVTFTIPENQLQRLFDARKNGEVQIDAAHCDLAGKCCQGKLNMIDNQIDTSTGMIKVRGIFPNDDSTLWPGEFVQTRLIFYQRQDAIIIPYQAVISTPDGHAVYVLTKNDTVEMQYIKLGQREDGNIIVEKGIDAGDIVVTEGQLNLSSGVSVSVKKGVKEVFNESI